MADMNTVFSQLEQVRTSGETNMLDRNAVRAIASRDGLVELADHMDEIGRGGYGKFLMSDFSDWLVAQENGS